MFGPTALRISSLSCSSPLRRYLSRRLLSSSIARCKNSGRPRIGKAIQCAQKILEKFCSVLGTQPDCSFWYQQSSKSRLEFMSEDEFKFPSIRHLPARITVEET